MNSIVIHGRLARSPKSKSYVNEQGESRTVCNFTVAVNRRVGDEADFFNCTVFGRRADVIEKWFRKGSEIVCRGHMQCDPYEDKETGKKRYPWKLIVDDFDFCGSKRDKDEHTEDAFEDSEADIPF